jgi:hypothetical protein
MGHQLRRNNDIDVRATGTDREPAPAPPNPRDSLRREEEDSILTEWLKESTDRPATPYVDSERQTE